MSSHEYPPEPTQLEPFFQTTIEKYTSDFETVRWLVWLFDALESEEWESVKYRTWVLIQQADVDDALPEARVNRLANKIDAKYGRWLGDE